LSTADRPIAIHVSATVTERRVAVRCSVQI